LPIIIAGLLLAFGVMLFSAKSARTPVEYHEQQVEEQPQNPKPQQRKVSSTAWIKQLLSHWLMSSQLGKVLGRQQAKYLQKTQAMFEQNNLQEALKHALPLSDVNSLFHFETAPSFFGKLSEIQTVAVWQ